jgi:hypothetical protein
MDEKEGFRKLTKLRVVLCTMSLTTFTCHTGAYGWMAHAYKETTSTFLKQQMINKNLLTKIM